MNRILKIGIDFLLLAAPALTALMMNLYVDPFQRGLFCDDESIRYPFRDDTISTLTIALVGGIFGVSLIIIVETVLKASNDSFYTNDSRGIMVYKWKISPYIQNLYHFIGLLLFSMSINQFITDGTKFAVGRLRPHYIDLCRPRIGSFPGAITTCDDPENHNRYIQNFSCSSGASLTSLKNGRLSFPSGHTSFAFVVAVYCVFYLESRMKYSGSKLLKHFIQFCIICGAIYTGLSRISDYKHHYTDVLAGLILGSVISYVVCFHISKLFKRDRYFDGGPDV
ncbi:putative phosphatidate phosphatase [Chironomus tepperi]|uniref:putative phosphatidate phosphatase n=1 Tax=Chironomus tepperi TaxID=113505 RepID=UPI00391F6F56